jgi:large subunit ribosomal protein L25
MAQSTVLTAHKRTKLGSRSSRKLRDEGRIPANIQGDGDHVDVSIDASEFLASRRAHVHLYDIDVEGTQETAVVEDLQWDTFGDSIIHIEFRKVQRGVATLTEVALEFVGHPLSGVINHLVDSIEISCLPSLIPDSLLVKVEGLAEGSHLKAADILLPEGVTLACDPGLDIATIIGAQGHEREPGEEGEEGEGPEEPELA